MKDIVVFGAGDAGELADFYFARAGRKVAAFVVDDREKAPALLQGRPVVAFADLMKAYPPSKFDAFVAIGYSKMNTVRREKFLTFKKLGYVLANCVSQTASVNPLKIGENNMIQEGVIIQPFAEIGDNCVFWGGTHIGHHSKVASHCFFGPRVAVAGHVHIGETSFLGINSTIKNHVKIGRGVLVAAGALVVEDVPDEMLVRGLKSKMVAVDDPVGQKI